MWGIAKGAQGKARREAKRRMRRRRRGWRGRRGPLRKALLLNPSNWMKKGLALKWVAGFFGDFGKEAALELRGKSKLSMEVS